MGICVRTHNPAQLALLTKRLYWLQINRTYLSEIPIDGIREVKQLGKGRTNVPAKSTSMTDVQLAPLLGQ